MPEWGERQRGEMAFRLSKADMKRCDELVARLRECAERLVAAIEAANAQIEQAVARVNGDIAAYNEALAEAKNFGEQFVHRMRKEYNEKSDRWQEGDIGQAVSGWIDEWEGLDLEEIDEVSVDPVEEPDMNHADELVDAPERPG
jgi:uncharacterized protein YPO0396